MSFQDAMAWFWGRVLGTLEPDDPDAGEAADLYMRRYAREAC